MYKKTSTFAQLKTLSRKLNWKTLAIPFIKSELLLIYQFIVPYSPDGAKESVS